MGETVLCLLKEVINMNTISSLDQRSCTFAEKRVARTLCRITPFALLVLTMLVMPIAVIAKDKENDHERDDQRHHLIDHKRVEEMHRHRGHLHQESTVTPPDLQAQVTDLQNKVASLTSANASMMTALQTAQGQITTLQASVAALKLPAGGAGSSLAALAQYVTVKTDPIDGLSGPHVIFTGVNVHIRSGSNATGDNGTPLGLGNLVVGYNAVQTGGLRTGSHNIIGGDGNSFTSYGGLVFGSQNTISGPYSAILGGEANQIGTTSFASSILGGRQSSINSGDQTIP
jgi:hypothetical protein